MNLYCIQVSAYLLSVPCESVQRPLQRRSVPCKSVQRPLQRWSVPPENRAWLYFLYPQNLEHSVGTGSVW